MNLRLQLKTPYFWIMSNETPRCINYAVDAQWWCSVATKIRIYTMAPDARWKDWGTLSLMTTSCERDHDIQLHLHYLSYDEGETNKWWTSWIRSSCEIYDVQLQVEYDYAKLRSILTATCSFWISAKLDLPGWRPAVGDDLRLVRAGLLRS